MYHTHWGLRTSPFGSEAGVSNANAGFDEALSRIKYLLDQRGRIGLLLGSAGTGKTTLAKRFCEEARKQGSLAALIGGKGCTENAFVSQLARGWLLSLGNDHGSSDEWDRIADRLTELRYELASAVVALDDADLTSAKVLCQVERLLHLALNADSQLTIVLVSSLESAGNLGSALLEQVELRIDLSPWSEDETAEHVALRLFHSGSDSPIFTDEAITALHELSGGIPRKVEQIAQLALLAGAGQQLTEIDALTLTEAYQELGVGGL
jgi:type II secretory pathway predicted ATPase ExeA